MSIKPVANKILVKPHLQTEEQKTASGIILAPVVRETQIRGEVIIIGNDVTLVQPGDNIYYIKHAGVEVKEDANVYLIMNEVDVLAIIKDESCTSKIT